MHDIKDIGSASCKREVGPMCFLYRLFQSLCGSSLFMCALTTVNKSFFDKNVTEKDVSNYFFY